MKKAYSLFVLFLVVVLAVVALVGCTPEPKTIKEIYIVSAVDEEVQVGDFDIANYRVRLIMTDGTDKYVTIKDNMLNMDLDIFNEVGEHYLTAVYNNNILTHKIKIIDRLYRVTFETNKGSKLAPRSTRRIMDRPVTSREEHIFAGWYDNAEFIGAQILFPLTLSEDLALYAKWVEEAEGVDVYQVNFDFNYDEAIIYTPQFIPIGEKVVEPSFLTREGYEIVSWHLEAAGLWDFDTDTVEANITLVATWGAV